MSIFYREIARHILLSPTFVESMTAVMAVEIERQIKANAGGDRLWIPKTSSREDLQERNRMIRAQFNGRNHAALASAFNLCERQVRKILNSAPEKFRSP